MACSLMVALARDHDLGAVSLFPEARSWVEQRLRGAHIPMWHLDKRPGFDPRLFTRFDRVVREFRPDVVHSHMSVLRYTLPSILRRQVPLAVHTLHNLARHETDLFGRALQWLMFRGVVVPVAISPEVARSVEQYYKFPCRHLVPNCIPLERFRCDPHARVQWRSREGIDPRATVFVSTARFVPQKNPFLLLEAFARFEDARAHLLLLGRGALQDQVENFIRERGLAARVRVLGYRPDIPECLAASDIFVLSSDWEGNPLAVMEALAAGLPVVSTAVGGVPSLVEDGRSGLLVPPGDCAAFAEAMHFLLHNPQIRTSMSIAARSHAQREFSLDRMVDGYREIYQSCLAGKK